MLDKRGQGLSTNAIILIILGVIILVILVLGFTMGWKKLLPFISQDNVETIKTSCVSACSTGNIYGFCTQNRTLKADGLPLGEDGKVPKEMIGNCSLFSTSPDFAKYGIGDCNMIDCED